MPSKPETVAFLKTVDLLKGLDDENLGAFSDSLHELSFKAESVVFKEQEGGDVLFFIYTGAVRILKGIDKPMLITILKEGEFFGEMGVLDDDARSCSVEAQHDTVLLGIRKADFDKLLAGHPQIGRALIRTLVARVRDMQQELMNARKAAEFYQKKAQAKT